MNINELIIFAGGYGSRLSEETKIIPKPLVEIGDRPIIWHIMKHYEYYNIRNFIIALGYKGVAIKKYFMDYDYLNNDLEIELCKKSIRKISNKSEDWNIKLIDTGLKSLTTKRLNQAMNLITNDNFYLTYGDAVSDVNLNKLKKSHIKSGKILTITAVNPPPRFGKIKMSNKTIMSFQEKKIDQTNFINGGYFIVNKKIKKYLNNSQAFEAKTMQSLLKDNQINIYLHKGFWMCMDTLADKNNLNNLWLKEKPWKIW